MPKCERCGRVGHPEDKEYVYREVFGVHVEKIKIPEGSIKCPDCKGSGRYRYRYSEPGPFHNPASDWMSCILCGGKGFVELDYLRKYHPDKIPSINTICRDEKE